MSLRLRAHLPTIFALLMLAITVLGVLLPPLLSSHDPFSQHLDIALTPPFSRLAHPLGTDPLGRDLLSRLALAGRTSIFIAFASLAISLCLGTALGLIAGYLGGTVSCPTPVRPSQAVFNVVSWPWLR